MGYVTNNSIGKTKQVLDADVEQIETFLAHQLPDFVSTLVMLLAMFIIMFSQNVWLAFSCLLPIVVGFVCQFAVMIKILKSGGLKENFDALEKNQFFFHPVRPRDALYQNLWADSEILSEVL